MKISYILILMVIVNCFAACQSNSTKNNASEENEIVKEQPKVIEKNEIDNNTQLIADFLNLFESVAVDQEHPLFIETTKDQGQRILPKFDTLLHQIPLTSKETHMESDGYIYAVNHFKIDEVVDGLIIRHYGKYIPNLLSLFLWDKEIGGFLKQNGKALSIAYGDAGWKTRTSSIISEFNKDGQLEILSKQVNMEEDFETATTIVLEDKINNLKLENHQFVKGDMSIEDRALAWKSTLGATNKISLIDSEIEAVTTESENVDLPFLFSPTSIAGIGSYTTKEKLKALFPNQVLEDIILYDYEDIATSATLVKFENEANNLPVVWKSDRDTPLEIQLENKAAGWQTKEGIKIGSSIEAVEAANGKAFTIYGFEIDGYLAGSIQNWEGGNLDPLWLQFEYQNDLPFEEFSQIMGSEGILSDHQVIKKAGLVVKNISIRF